MKKDRAALLFLACGGMELSWRYAWATFLMSAIVNRPFPLPEAVGAFVLAAALRSGIRGIGLRVVLVLGLQILGFLLAASRIIYALSYRAYPYFSHEWLARFFGSARSSLEWLTIGVVLALALFFWLAGVTLAGRSTAYLTICGRFDYGVTAFFCLFIVKSVMLVKGGIEVKDPAPVLLLFPFFIFSLLAVGLARTGSTVRKDFLADYRGIGVLLSFGVVVLAAGAGMVLFFMPHLMTAAEAGYGVLKSAAGPLGPVLVQVLRFLFRGSRLRQEPASSASAKDASDFVASGESSWWTELVQKALGWGFLGLGLLIGSILVAIGMWYLLRWLFSRTSKDERKHLDWRLALCWFQKLWAAFAAALQKALQRLKGCRDAVQLYRAFLKWGRRSGLPHLLNETPAEYGLRLRRRFPSLAGKIEGIVEAFNLAVYGEVALDDAQMALARGSWRRLCNPQHWPARLKSLFLH